MSHFMKITSGLNVAPLLAELDAHPELWNTRPERRVAESPHRETDDIWCRYASAEVMRDPGFATKPHLPTWWPAGLLLQRGLRYAGEPIIEALGGARALEPMGGILITRIPAGKQVYPHHDRGTWHAEHYDCKVWIVLRGNDRCINMVEDESMVWKPGEAWQHDNLLTHSVRNEGATERICLIICFRRTS